MFPLIAMLLLQIANPFWETKPTANWSVAECERLLRNSPWVQADSPYRVYITSAEPVRIAEERIRAKAALGGEVTAELDQDYQQFVNERYRDHVIVGVHMPNPTLLFDPREVADVVKESRMKLGKRKHKLVAHFPPTAADPVLRLVFPKKLVGDEKTLTLELYIPGSTTPWRNFEFLLKDLTWKGKAEF